MSSPQRLIGQTIGRYRIVELLGRGGMAEVYKAYQESLDRNVAIKLMHAFLADEEGFLSRFQREARAMAALSHPNIVSVYDFDVQDGTYYIVMEFVSGGTLKQSLEGLAALGERLPLSHTVQIVLEIADALAYAHSRAMVHRDIKPANIMLNEDGRAVLTDFGIAKILSGPSFTATGAMIGTPSYMSPEQGLGQAGDERSDLYALGVLFFQMATGRLPYDADTPLAVILKHVNEPIPDLISLNAEIPEAIRKVILKAMAKEPSERYQSANAMANDLRAAVRVSNMEMGTVIPSELLQDRPTPPPMRTVQGGSSNLGSTMLPSTPTPIVSERTRVGGAKVIEHTNIAAAPTPTRHRSRVPLIAAIVVVLLLLAGIAGGFALANRGNGDESPTSVAAGGDATETPELTEQTAPEEAVVQETVDIGATAAAAVAIALTSQATDTPLPTLTGEPSPTPTPNLTATFLASCEPEVELVHYYTFQEDLQSVPVNSDFTMNWVLANSGDCPIAAGVRWSFVEGQAFEQAGPVDLESELGPGEEVILTTPFTAPSQPGNYESTWQLLDEDDSPVGEPLTFEIAVYLQSTPTATPTLTPVVTDTPAATATPAVTAGPLDFNFSVSSCEYVGQQWRCLVTFNPIGGVGPYTLTVFDSEPPSEYQGSGPFNHLIVSGRCFPWINNVRLQDDGTGASVSRDVFISPDPYFPGGCSETDPPGG